MLFFPALLLLIFAPIKCQNAAKGSKEEEETQHVFFVAAKEGSV